MPNLAQNLFTKCSFFDCFVPNGAERGNPREALRFLAFRPFFAVSLLCQTKRNPTFLLSLCRFPVSPHWRPLATIDGQCLLPASVALARVRA